VQCGGPAARMHRARPPEGVRPVVCRSRCNPHEIKSITGHKTLAEVERYTRAVDRERLAREAATKLGTAKVTHKTVGVSLAANNR
jgi:hypothetical protein